MAAGADGYMIKPFTGENLMRRARQMLKQVRLAA
jgi:DNA-binding response OmpR family regulator